MPEVNPATRTLEGADRTGQYGAKQLVPGMFVNLTFPQSGSGDALLVPSEAVIKTGRRSVVVVALGEGRFAPVDVETGAEADDKTEVRSGLKEGQKVVLSGQFLIDSEASLRAAFPKMSETTPVASGMPVHHGA
ncbi:hypothetical protein LP420_38315 [Massilia sp. B-10]|nr:hypothetical protein LP420_38315 [Massilia sp. B-10]